MVAVLIKPLAEKVFYTQELFVIEVFRFFNKYVVKVGSTGLNISK